MNRDDRYHTTSWDGQQQPQRQAPAGGAGERTAKPAPAKPAARKKKKKARRRGMNPILGFILWVIIVIVVSVVLACVGWMLANDMCAFNKAELTATVEVTEDWIDRVETVEDEDGEKREVTYYNMETAAAALKEAGLIEYEWFFRLFAWVYNGDEKITQGTFVLDTDMDYMALIRGMRATGGTAVTVDVSIPEGYSVRQILNLLAENGVGTIEDLEDAAANHVFDYGFVDNENLGDITRLEGYLFPDTYEFYVGANPVIALNSMLRNFDSKIYNNGELMELFSESEYEMQDIITIASLIEKETDGSDRSNISSVIYNRLNNAAETAYFLQIDAALVYAAGREITQDDYQNLDSPYNLYTHTGLPPTPIGNPGLASIKAALSPADTNYYFYVLGADGKHIFNETLAGHQKTIASLG